MFKISGTPVRGPSWPSKANSKAARQLFDMAKRKGIRAKQMAQTLGVTTRTISLWRRGHATMRVDQEERLAEMLGFDLILRKRDTANGSQIDVTKVL